MCQISLPLADIAVVQHLSNDPVPPGQRGVVMADRVIIVGRFRQGRKIGGLGDIQFIQWFAEIGLGRRRPRHRTAGRDKFR